MYVLVALVILVYGHMGFSMGSSRKVSLMSLTSVVVVAVVEGFHVLNHRWDVVRIEAPILVGMFLAMLGGGLWGWRQSKSIPESREP